MMSGVQVSLQGTGILGGLAGGGLALTLVRPSSTGVSGASKPGLRRCCSPAGVLNTGFQTVRVGRARWTSPPMTGGVVGLT